MSQYDEQIQMKAQEIYEAQTQRELDKGATDNQARARAQKMADRYADDMNRTIERWLDTREELRQTVAQLADLGKRRDELIRQGLAEGVSAAHLAADARFKGVARIYQIRDGRR